MAGDYSVVGKALPFVDGREKVTGRARYLDDLSLPGMLYGKILRSPYPHARIARIDPDRARKLPGVKAVITAEDCPATRFGLEIPDVSILAGDKVRYVGDEVAAVAAVSEEIAEEALSLIKVEYVPLPSVDDLEAALAPGAPLVHDDKPGNIARTYKIERGDVEADFSGCDYVFEEEFSTSRVLPCYLEPFGVIADWESDGRLTIWTGIQAAFHARFEIARALNIQPSDVSVKVPYIGGGFGGKIWIRNFHPIAALLAKKAGRPMKIVLSREEEFLASRPRVAAKIRVRLGLMRDGTLVCKEMKIIADNGAYSWAAPKILLNMSMRTDCLYRFRSTRTEAMLVYTNKTPTSGFRGYGNAQSHFALESMVDICARKLGLDPVEVRLKNAVRRGDTTLHGWKIRSCGLGECIEKVSAAIQVNRFPREEQGGRIKRGVGVACVTHVSGNRGGNNFDGSCALVRFQEDGKLLVYSGESDMGQGARTVFAQIAAETLGIPLESVKVMPLDTDMSPFGYGTYSSRVTTVGGKAVLLASQQVRRQLLTLAGKVLNEDPSGLDLKDGEIFVRLNPGKKVLVAEVCRVGIRTREATELTAYVSYDPPTEGTDGNFCGDYSSAYNYGAHAAEVEVDTETGQVKVLRVAAAHDVGYPINPNGVRGQIYGGVAQGIGWALHENLVYKGGVLQNPSLSSYILLTIKDMPKVEPFIVSTNDPVGPYGAKGVGEPALIPTPPAVANALEDALGVRFHDLPITPEQVFLALYPKPGEVQK